MKNKLEIFLFCIMVLLFSPLAYASNYGEGNYSQDIYVGNDTLVTLYCGDGSCNNGETCSSCPGDCTVGCSSSSSSSSSSSGGGGGGRRTIAGRNVTNGTSVTSSAFYVAPNLISVNIEKGKSYMQQIMVYNKGSKNLSISVSPSRGISNFVQINEKTFVLKEGESKVYNFYVYASTKSKTDLYTGTLIFDAGDVESVVDMIIGIQELPVLFDMGITSTKKYVLPGKIVSGEVRISNIGDAESVKAVLEYGVMSFDNVVYSSREENIVVARDILVKKVSLKLPEDIGIGRHILYAKIVYGEKIAFSSDTFQVEQISVIIWLISIITILVLLLLIIFEILQVKRKGSNMQRFWSFRKQTSH